ncbi:MAG: D-glycero-beta-D-manno-heptose 1,7-bisphosphate 7-phosphatase [Gammaproteobacteria bacterium]
MAKLIILDRDGVINWETGIDSRVTSPEEWKEIPGSLEAIVKLKKAGFTVCVATNQSIVSKGIITINTLNAIHNKMQQALQTLGGLIDQIFVCPHKTSDNCLCRKPKPGMLLAAAKAYNVDYANQQVPFVGDSDVDILAARAGGLVPVLVKTGKGHTMLDQVNSMSIKNLLVFDDLSAFADYWIMRSV